MRRGAMRFAAILALVVATTAGAFQDSRPADRPAPGLRVIARSKIDVSGSVPAVVCATTGVLYRTDEAGLPIVSKAGLVQVAHEGEGFFYANILPRRRRYAEKRGDFDTDNWGDVDALRMLGRVVRRWRERNPAGPRLGIEDISSPFGGFADYDGDGAADHRTHQLGSHVNVLLPCTVVPEVEVHFGVRDADKYDAEGGQLLAVMLFEEGVRSITTTSATEVLERPAPFPLGNVATRETATGTKAFRIGTRQSLILMKAPHDHGNHLNAALTPSW